MNKFRWLRLLNIILQISGGFYIFALYENGTITEDLKSCLIDVCLSIFFTVDIIITLVSKETIIYYYGINKMDRPNIYRLWICFEIIMVICIIAI